MQCEPALSQGLLQRIFVPPTLFAVGAFMAHTEETIYEWPQILIMSEGTLGQDHWRTEILGSPAQFHPSAARSPIAG